MPGVVLLDVGPERGDQNTREVDQRVVIQRRAAFIEVADENVADRAAADVVVLDQFRGRSLAAPQHGAEGELGGSHPDHAEDIPGHVQSRDLFASGVGMNAPRVDLQDVLGGQRVDVLTGMQHDLADQTQRVATITATEPAVDRGLVEAVEHLRPHDLVHPIEQTSRSIGGQEVITGQDNPAHQQARQPRDVFLPLGDHQPSIAGRQLLDPAHIVVSARRRPSILPALAGVGQQPTQNRGSSLEPDIATDGRGWPVWEHRQQCKDVFDRQAIHRTHSTSIKQLLIGDQVVPGAAGLRCNSRRGHGGIPPNSTDRSSVS